MLKGAVLIAFAITLPTLALADDLADYPTSARAVRIQDSNLVIELEWGTISLGVLPNNVIILEGPMPSYLASESPYITIDPTLSLFCYDSVDGVNDVVVHRILRAITDETVFQRETKI